MLQEVTRTGFDSVTYDQAVAERAQELAMAREKVSHAEISHASAVQAGLGKQYIVQLEQKLADARTHLEALLAAEFTS